MKSLLGVRSTRLLTATAVAAVSALALPLTALAAPATVTFDCQGDSPVGQQQFTLDQATSVNAPAQVAPGAKFDIVVNPEPDTIPGEVNGYEVKNVTGMDLKLPVPDNSTYVSAEIAGGSGLGPTPPKISVADGIATVHLAGPMQGGARFELPTITFHLTAGQSGTIETKLHGTGYDNPGLTFTAVVSTLVGDVDVPSACYPNPNPVLTTTTIG